LDEDNIERLIVDNDIDTIIHLASILSALGERDPKLAMDVNVKGLHIVLEAARKFNVRLFAPSSIAAFGPSTPKENTPDLTIMRPTTIYGVTKVYLELLGEYYRKKYSVDFRSLRYPGILSTETLPGGGTTDYAVDIFYHALREGKYTCFLKPDSRLPMLYMPDCLEGTIAFLTAPDNKLSQRVYNLAAISFTPHELAEAIKKRMPKFVIEYKPDFRQQIADSWPQSIDDSKARQDWGWKHNFGLQEMVDDMLKKIGARLKSGK